MQKAAYREEQEKKRNVNRDKRGRLIKVPDLRKNTVATRIKYGRYIKKE